MTTVQEYVASIAVIILVMFVFFMLGHSIGREHQCGVMGYEYNKGKCVEVTRVEVKK